MNSLLLLLTTTLLLSACSNYTWVRKDSLAQAQEQMTAQDAEKRQLIAQQEKLTDLLQRLHLTLEQNQQLAQAIDHLSQALTRPLRLDASQLRVAQAGNAPAASNEKPSNTAPRPDDRKMLVGAVETVWFSQLKKKIESRIDTGAQTSSLNVAHYEIIERDGAKWVRFSLEESEDEEKDKKKDEDDKTETETGSANDEKDDDKSDGEPKIYEQKLVKYVNILQSSSEEKERRPVIKLRVVIGSMTQEIDFTLADRGHLSYPALIGRNALRDVIIVDVSKSHIAKLPKDLKD